MSPNRCRLTSSGAWKNKGAEVVWMLRSSRNAPFTATPPKPPRASSPPCVPSPPSSHGAKGNGAAKVVPSVAAIDRRCVTPAQDPLCPYKYWHDCSRLATRTFWLYVSRRANDDESLQPIVTAVLSRRAGSDKIIYRINNVLRSGSKCCQLIRRGLDTRRRIHRAR